MAFPAISDFLEEEINGQIQQRVTFWTDVDPSTAPNAPDTELTSLRTAIQGGVNVVGDAPPAAELGNDLTTPQYQNNNGAGSPVDVWWMVLEQELYWSAIDANKFIPLAHARSGSAVPISTGGQLEVDSANTQFQWGDLGSDYLPPGSSGATYNPNHGMMEIIFDALVEEDGSVDGYAGTYDTLRVIYVTSSTELYKDYPLTVSSSILSEPGQDGEILFSDPATVTVSSGDPADGDTLDSVQLALFDSTKGSSDNTRVIAADLPEDVSQTSGPTIDAPVDIEISNFRFVV